MLSRDLYALLAYKIGLGHYLVQNQVSNVWMWAKSEITSSAAFLNHCLFYQILSPGQYISMSHIIISFSSSICIFSNSLSGIMWSSESLKAYLAFSWTPRLYEKLEVTPSFSYSFITFFTRIGSSFLKTLATKSSRRAWALRRVLKIWRTNGNAYQPPHLNALWDFTQDFRGISIA